jgi:hypothetical protein
VDATLLLSSLAAAVAGGLFLSAGTRVLRRPAAGDSQQALLLFSVWWYGLSIYALGGASQDMLAAIGLTPIAVFLALRYMQMIALCIGLWGLVYYVAFLITGKRHLLAPLAAFYSLYYAVILFLVTRSVPIDVIVQNWRSEIVLADPFVNGIAVALLLAIPPLVACITYSLAYPHAAPGIQRARVVLIIASTAAWSISMLAREVDWAAMLPLFLGIASGASIAWAYDPPAWLEKRLSERDAAA